MIEPIHPAQVAALKRMTVAQKLEAMDEMWQLARAMLTTQVRERNPDWEEEAVRQEVRRRLLYGTS